MSRYVLISLVALTSFFAVDSSQAQQAMRLPNVGGNPTVSMALLSAYDLEVPAFSDPPNLFQSDPTAVAAALNSATAGAASVTGVASAYNNTAVGNLTNLPNVDTTLSFDATAGSLAGASMNTIGAYSVGLFQIQGAATTHLAGAIYIVVNGGTSGGATGLSNGATSTDPLIPVPPEPQGDTSVVEAWISETGGANLFRHVRAVPTGSNTWTVEYINESGLVTSVVKSGANEYINVDVFGAPGALNGRQYTFGGNCRLTNYDVDLDEGAPGFSETWDCSASAWFQVRTRADE
ncbi:MAG: hypothetical protein KDA63_12230 [Planctomycetales bacterium]|nr:hypothetical protein [Planctomycetales bacterium]